jgi:hypothetical protein
LKFLESIIFTKRNKKMKLKIKKFLILVLVCSASALMSACIGSDEADAAFGTITINLGGDESRSTTITYPPDPALKISLQHTIEFKAGSISAADVVLDPGVLSKSIPLHVGIWDITVKAKKNNGDDYAIGKAKGVEVLQNRATPVRIQMEPVLPPVTSGTVWLQDHVAKKIDPYSDLNTARASMTSGGTYTIWLEAGDQQLPAATFFDPLDSYDITLRSQSGPVTVKPLTQNWLFRIYGGISLTLRDGITLQGPSGNNIAPLVLVDGGKLIMKEESKITGNTHTDIVSTKGGGVFVDNGGIFTMEGGTISGNKASLGGGVYVADGTFNMESGSIENNTATVFGGGVYVLLSDTSGMKFGTINKTGGTIYGNDVPGKGNMANPSLTIDPPNSYDNSSPGYALCTEGYDIVTTYYHYTFENDTLYGNYKAP